MNGAFPPAYDRTTAEAVPVAGAIDRPQLVLAPTILVSAWPLTMAQRLSRSHARRAVPNPAFARIAANRQGASTLLTLAQHRMVGDMKQTVDLTYLVDPVIMVDGRNRFHARSPVNEFQGVLCGVPSYVGKRDLLMENGA